MSQQSQAIIFVVKVLERSLPDGKLVVSVHPPISHPSLIARVSMYHMAPFLVFFHGDFYPPFWGPLL